VAVAPIPDLARADRLIEAFMARTANLVTMDTPRGRAAARELLELLADADADMARRLRIWNRYNGGPEMRFTEASLLAYRAQIGEVLDYVKRRLEGLTNAEAMAAAETSLARTGRLLNGLNRAFAGVKQPLRFEQALITRMRPSLLARHATSVDRYGASMVRQLELELSRGLASGMTQGQMVRRLIKMKGPQGVVSLSAVEVQPGMVVRIRTGYVPEGLFVARRGWAWRVVRTEVAEAQNAVSQRIVETGRETFPDMKRKILAVMDLRTANDSLGVHGQIRAVGEEFVDGAGRRYLRPPSRPNDRETLIPWRERWPETAHSRPLTQTQQQEIAERNEQWQERWERRSRARARRMAARARQA
jgi:hypothetical protein